MLGGFTESQVFVFYFVVVLVKCSEMLEAVGHEFMEEFFRCCEYVLADDGLIVLQVSHS